jgi:hypothetical protein
MQVGDLVRHKQFPRTFGVIVATFKSSRQSLTCTILWAIKPWYVDLSNPNDLVESACQLEVINE